MKNGHTPVVLAGVDYLHPLYREGSAYPGLVPEGLVGNFDRTAANDLHKQAWALVRAQFLKKEAELAELYRRLIGTSQAVDQMAEVVPAAVHGRVEVLFVAPDASRWGRFDPSTDRVDLHDSAGPGDEDLLELAAAHTLLHGGVTFPAVIEGMNPEAPVAAILRY